MQPPPHRCCIPVSLNLAARSILTSSLLVPKYIFLTIYCELYVLHRYYS